MKKTIEIDINLLDIPDELYKLDSQYFTLLLFVISKLEEEVFRSD